MQPAEEYWRFSDGAGTWIFGAVCVVIALVLVRLILRERLTLQGSMSYLGFLVLLGGMALFPDATGHVAHALGFSTLANFFFCTAIAALAILHLRALLTLSRIQLRSITLVQDLAILQEKLERSLASAAPAAAAAEAASAAPAVVPNGAGAAKDRTEPAA
ncbi:MAG TPA: DUF2304 domain-containing protein [Kofleriaceae bacterium]|nr:DUF2304 domain-containing protein [Kofleriaceae bacterium]